MENIIKYASEARWVSEESICQEKRVANAIAAAARENRIKLKWSVYDTNPVIIERLINKLVAQEYKVEVLIEGIDDLEKVAPSQLTSFENVAELIISW